MSEKKKNSSAAANVSSADERKVKRRKVINLKTKIEILDRLVQGQGPTSVGKLYGMNESTIRSIQRNEEAIRKTISCGSKMLARLSSYTKDATKAKMEDELVIWVEQFTKKRIPVNGNAIKQKALELYKQYKEADEPSASTSKAESTAGGRKQEFSASSGWLSRFLARNNVNNIELKSDAETADETAAQEFVPNIAKIIDEGGYTADQVFNVDETGLYWKKMPSRTNIAKAENSTAGFKVSRERITFLLCCNASGERILKPLLVNRSLRPRAVVGVDLKQLPINWKAHKRAWITQDMFTEWFTENFIPEVRSYLSSKGLAFKALLIVGNAPVDPQLNDPNVQIVFLPPSTIPLIQPLNQGILSTFKSYYVKRTFQYILDTLDNHKPASIISAWKKYNIMDCINNAALALNEIGQSTKNACWKQLWPECVRAASSVTPSTAEIHFDIIIMARAIGGEGFEDLTYEDIEELMDDKLRSDESVGDIVAADTMIESQIKMEPDVWADEDVSDDASAYASELPDYEDEEQDLKPEVSNAELGSAQILEGIQMAFKLANHFYTNDSNVERAVQFQLDLNTCMAPYQELYKQMTKGGVASRPSKVAASKETRQRKGKKNQASQQNKFFFQDPIETTSSSVNQNESSDDSDYEPKRKSKRND